MLFITMIQKLAADTFVNGKTQKVIDVVTNMGSFVSIYCQVPGEKFPQKFTLDNTCEGNSLVIRDCKPEWVCIEERSSKKDDGEGGFKHYTNYWIRCIGTSADVTKFYQKNAKFVKELGADWNEAWGEVKERPAKQEETVSNIPTPDQKPMGDLASMIEAVHKGQMK